MGHDRAERFDSDFLKTLAQLGRSVMVLERCCEEFNNMGERVHEIRIQAPREVGGEYRAIIKVQPENGPMMVGFRNAATLSGLVADLSQAVTAGTLRLREDTPYEQRVKSAQ